MSFPFLFLSHNFLNRERKVKPFFLFQYTFVFFFKKNLLLPISSFCISPSLKEAAKVSSLFYSDGKKMTFFYHQNTHLL
jgi:hypothetical protein